MSTSMTVVLVVTLSQVPAFAKPDDWKPSPAPEVQGVKVDNLPTRDKALPVFDAQDAVVSGTKRVSWPASGTVLVPLPADSAAKAGLVGPRGGARVGEAGRAKAGGMPIWVGAAPLTAADLETPSGIDQAQRRMPASVSVHVADRDATRAAGVNGVLLGVTRSDGRPIKSDVAVEIDYSGFRHAFGGDWASRLRLTAWTGCPTADSLDGCAASKALRTTNSLPTGRLAAAVPLAADSGFTVLSVAAAEGGDNGDYKATSLNAAGTWQVTAQTGGFGWSYPLRMVPGVGGPEPKLGLSYSSQAVDGRTANTNSQGSWIGDGWEMWPGFVERKYQTCSEDTDAVNNQDPNNKTKKTGDQCWFNDNATVSLNGSSTELIKAADGKWHGVTDQGWKIERLTDTSLGNGDAAGQYWVVTTQDGTRYFFGRNRRTGFPTDTAQTNSTWTTDVYGNHPGEPCYKSGDFAGSRCDTAWRWNLDYVIDPHGNSMTLFYVRETGAYGRESDPDKRETYHRGGYLERIEYGTRSGSEHTATVPARVMFDVLDRCKPGATCNADTPASWPDTPWDKFCKSGAKCTDQLAPTFWTQKRLDRIRAQVWRGSSHVDVESWKLNHEYLDAGSTTGEGIPMWLRSIVRTGHVTTAGGVAESDLPIVFSPSALPLANRVDGPSDGRTALMRWRLHTITTESGGQIGITYKETNCTRSSLPTPETNTTRCMPQWYAPEGVEPTLDWFHKYVVARVDQYDNTGAFEHQQINYDYIEDAAWHYDDSELVEKKKRTWGQWRGYRKVRVREGLESGTQSVKEYLYLRGMNGDRLNAAGGTKSVSVTDSQGQSIVDHEAHSGFMREETVLNGLGGAWVSGSIHDPWRHGPIVTSGPLKAYKTNTGATRTRVALASGGPRWKKTVTSFDTTYGMPTQVDEIGDESTAADDRCVRYEYARNTVSWMVDKVKRVETVGVNCSTAVQRPLHVVSDERTFYDNPDTHGATPTRGLAVKSQEVGSWSGSTPNWVTTARTVYDIHGRSIETYDALDQVSTTVFTPLTGGPVTQVETVDAGGMSETKIVERAWQLPTKILDANGHTSELTYDGIGRIREVWLPGRVMGTHTPNLKFEYKMRNNAPTAVTTRKLAPDGTNYITSVILYDGLLRERQSQTQTHGGGRTIIDTYYDSRGLKRSQTEAYYDVSGNPPSISLVGTAEQNSIPGVTDSVYDGAGRIAAEVFKVNGTEKWRTSYSYGGDRTHVTPPEGGTATTTLVDAHDQIVEYWQYRGPTPTGLDFDKTTYQYTHRGEPKRVTDSAGNVWTYEYDQRGNRTASVDPDKGRTETTYDNAGQITTVKDARGQIVAYTYDKLGRKRTARNGSITGTLRAEWVFDTLVNGKGKLTRSIRHDGGKQYISEIIGYDVTGRPTGNRLIIPTGEAGLDGSYETQTSYRPDGSVSATNLLAVNDLPFERLIMGYDGIGAPTFMSSSMSSLVGEVAYSTLGDLTKRVLGAPGKRVDITYRYDDATRRLSSMTAQLEASSEIVDLEYGYDKAGNLIRIADSPNQANPVDTQCFRYDYLGRLDQAWTPALGTTTNCLAQPSVGALGGPAKYWLSWEYDSTGNRKRQVDHRSTGDLTSTYAHPTNKVRPHAISSATIALTGGPQQHSFEYDVAGNLTKRTKPGAVQDLSWDAEGRVASITEGGVVTTFVYDADGNRLIRRDGTGKTAYLPGGQELRYDNATATRKCTRYYVHLGKTVAVRTSAGLTLQVSDHHGTAEISVKASDLTVGQRRTTPFGETRGAQPGYWAGDKGFVGGTVDPTGYVHLGARLYDAGLGRFLSVDPVIDINDPQQMHGYAYGNNAPPTFSDPDGLLFGSLVKAATNAVKATTAAVSNAASSVASVGSAVVSWGVANAGAISTALSVAAMVCSVIPPLQAAVPFLAAGAFAFGVVDTINSCASGNAIDCGVGVVSLIPGGKALSLGNKAFKAGEAARDARKAVNAADKAMDRAHVEDVWARYGGDDAVKASARRATEKAAHALENLQATELAAKAAQPALDAAKRKALPWLVADAAMNVEDGVFYRGVGSLNGNCTWFVNCKPRNDIAGHRKIQWKPLKLVPYPPSPSASGNAYVRRGGGHFLI